MTVSPNVAGLAELVRLIVVGAGTTVSARASDVEPAYWPAALAKVALCELGHSGAAPARYPGVAPSTVNRRAAEGDPSPLAAALLET